MKGFLALTLAAGMAVSIPALAAAYTGNDLLSGLKSGNAQEKLRAYAYIQGVMDYEGLILTKEVFSTFGKKPEAQKFSMNLACPPEGTINQQLFDLVQKELEENAATRHESALMFVRHAAMKAWPCRGNPIPR